MADSSLIDSFRDFAEREVRPAAREVDRSGEFPAGQWKKLEEYSLTGLAVPESHGGLGVDRSSVMVALEAVAGPVRRSIGYSVGQKIGINFR